MTLRLWDVHTGQYLQTFQEHGGRVYAVAFNKDGSVLASASEDQTVRLWEVSTGRCFKVLKGHSNRVRSITFSPAENTLATGSHDGTIKIWDLASGHCLQTLRGNRPYEGMNITAVKGITDMQKTTLKALGAIEF